MIVKNIYHLVIIFNDDRFVCFSKGFASAAAISVQGTFLKMCESFNGVVFKISNFGFSTYLLFVLCFF